MNTERDVGWSTLLRRLPRESLDTLMAELGLPSEETLSRLVLLGSGGPAEQAPWWPEALRMLETASIRAVARRFSTEPRRIRRALARTGQRASGVDLLGQGHPALGPLRAQLGHQPDRQVAKAAGVSVEAVHGERTRLGIEPFRQRKRVRLTADDEAWILGPKKARRERFRPEPERLQVVRRPSLRTNEPERAPTPVPTPMAAVPGPRETLPERGRVPTIPAAVDGLRRREFFRSEDADELQRLLQPVRHRDGRQRIVRQETPRPAPSESPPTVGRRRIVGGSGRGEPESTVAPLRSVSEVLPRPPRPVVRSAATAPAVQAEPMAVPSAPMLTWLVHVPDRDEPLVVHAPDIAGAIVAAARLLPPELVARASVWRADGGEMTEWWL